MRQYSITSIEKIRGKENQFLKFMEYEYPQYINQDRKGYLSAHNDEDVEWFVSEFFHYNHSKAFTKS